MVSQAVLPTKIGVLDANLAQVHAKRNHGARFGKYGPSHGEAISKENVPVPVWNQVHEGMYINDLL